MMIISLPSYVHDWQSHKMTGGGYTIILHWIVFINNLINQVISNFCCCTSTAVDTKNNYSVYWYYI